MNIGELIAVARECKGWTLRDLEKASGVSNPLISQIETGKVRDPGFTTVIRLMDALGLSLDRAATAEREKLKVLRKSGVWKPGEPAECNHDWKIWPETDGQEQKCTTCGAFRPTPVVPH